MKKRFVLVLIMMICLTTFSGGVLAYAKEREGSQPTYYKYYTSIRVEAGDTLWEIADRYLCEQIGSHEAYIREVMQMNGLKSTEIRTGESLTVFYYSTEVK
ncbi:MAG: LysM peptidoglycan-binding domain-containing protein [Lachnospiraceae bacterium]|nr:LysM peptidoglycan-binding domain-containing protein [Lachnospiraceae bacterium]